MRAKQRGPARIWLTVAGAVVLVGVMAGGATAAEPTGEAVRKQTITDGFESDTSRWAMSAGDQGGHGFTPGSGTPRTGQALLFLHTSVPGTVSVSRAVDLATVGSAGDRGWPRWWSWRSASASSEAARSCTLNFYAFSATDAALHVTIRERRDSTNRVTRLTVKAGGWQPYSAKWEPLAGQIEIRLGLVNAQPGEIRVMIDDLSIVCA